MAKSEYTAAQRRTAKAALVAIIELDAHMIRFERGEYKSFSNTMKAFPDTDKEQWYAVNQAFHALRSAASALAADQLTRSAEHGGAAAHRNGSSRAEAPPKTGPRRLIRIRGELRKNDRTLAAQDLVEFARLPGFIGGSVKEQHLEAGKWLSRRPAMTFSHAVAYLMWPKSDALPRDAELVSRRAAHLDGIAVSRVPR